MTVEPLVINGCKVFACDEGGYDIIYPNGMRLHYDNAAEPIRNAQRYKDGC